MGLLSGFNLGTSRASIARAALDSIAHQIADVVDAIDRSGTRVSRLFVDGGPTRNNQLMQFEADMIGRLVLRGKTTELSALGASRSSCRAEGRIVGPCDQLAEAGAAWRDVFEPRLDPGEAPD